MFLNKFSWLLTSSLLFIWLAQNDGIVKAIGYDNNRYTIVIKEQSGIRCYYDIDNCEPFLKQYGLEGHVKKGTVIGIIYGK